ncbi:hypothetical protein OUZ56_003453 [Daphnia magna]|uniref:Uncharacterized protein n=1 Tax=Daphnia magna TaxID=35525 RepID=A0ABR0A933_9CRUS|nr:hypothetical protein OUZ56_003453 [Daphnia magna]
MGRKLESSTSATLAGAANNGESTSQNFKRDSPIRAYVKVGPLVTHPARVAKIDDSNFCPTFALSIKAILMYA